MSDDGGVELAVDEFGEYCRTQAGLLSGKVERMGEEADALLDEIDEGAAEVRARLDARAGTGSAPASAETTTSPSGGRGGENEDAEDADLAAIERLESDLEEKQAIVEAKQARMRAFRELAAGYLGLAEELDSEAVDGREAMERVVRFEVDRDAPAYFAERETVCEAVADGSGEDA